MFRMFGDVVDFFGEHRCSVGVIVPFLPLSVSSQPKTAEGCYVAC